jgi:hypothetical protein
MRHFLRFREASLKKMHSLEQENVSLKTQLGIGKDNLNYQQQPAGGDMIRDLERRLEAMKMAHGQQILDLQARAVVGCRILLSLFAFQKQHAIESNSSFAQGLEVGQQKLVSTLAVAQAQIIELRSAAVEKDRVVMQLRHDMQHSVRLLCSEYRASHVFPIQSMARTIQELSETNAAMSTQFSYREKYWIQELNVAKAKIAEFEAQFEQTRQCSDSLALKQSKLESKYIRLLDIRNRLVTRLTSSLRM